MPERNIYTNMPWDPQFKHSCRLLHFVRNWQEICPKKATVQLAIYFFMDLALSFVSYCIKLF